MRSDFWINSVCFLLIFLFVYTAVSKLGNIETFSADMRNQPLPVALKKSLIWAVPFSELAAAGLLVFDKTRIAGLYASLILMLAFTVYTTMIVLNVFEYVPCSCGGIIKNFSWGQHLVFNIFFVAISLLGIGIYKTRMDKQHENKIENISRE